jgi:hypothetical protein
MLRGLPLKSARAVVRVLGQLLDVLLGCLHLLCGYVMLLLLLWLLELRYRKLLLRTYIIHMRVISIMNAGSGVSAMTWCGTWLNMFIVND